MTIEPIVLALPSVRSFIAEIIDAVRSKSVLVLIPDLVSRDMVARLLVNRFDVLAIPYRDISYSAEYLPAIWLSEQIGVSWPSPSTVKNIPNLLSCEGIPEIIHIRDFNTSETGNPIQRRRWLDLILDWVRGSRALAAGRAGPPPKLCLIAKLKDFDLCPPAEEEGLSVHWWWGFPSALEMRLACRMCYQEPQRSEAPTRWLEQVLPALAGNDVKLAEYLQHDIFGSFDGIIRGLKEYARIEGLSTLDPTEVHELDAVAPSDSPPSNMQERWSKGDIVSSPEHGTEYHPGLLAKCGQYRDIERRLWRGQAELLLPILNEIRIRICDTLTESFGEDWPVNPYRPVSDYELEAVVDNPRGAEFGHIEYLLKFIPKFRGKTELLPLVSQCRRLRNEIAHFRPVTFAEFERVWHEYQARLRTDIAS